MLYDFFKLNPQFDIYGIDISEYAVNNCIESLKEKLKVGNAVSLPYPDKYFDLVVSINTHHNLDGEDIINFIFGENSPHSNKVTYGIRGNIINNFDVDFRFDSDLLKEILNSNKKCGEGLIKFSTKGLLHYIFKEEGCLTDYYTTRKV